VAVLFRADPDKSTPLTLYGEPIGNPGPTNAISLREERSDVLDMFFTNSRCEMSRAFREEAEHEECLL
jgi:hypothetical protein